MQAAVEADQDVHGILGADPQIRNGFSGVRVSYTIDADATTEQIKALVAQSQKRSAVYDILTTPPTSPSACPEQGDAAPGVRKPTRRSGARFFEYFGHAKVRRGVRLLSKLPSAPRCEACGNPFAGLGGWLMRRMGKSPSNKNPRWCEVCFEAAPEGGVTLTIGVLFADVRNATALGETLPPHEMASSP